MKNLAITAAVSLALGCSKGQEPEPPITPPTQTSAQPEQQPQGTTMNVDLLRAKPTDALVNELVTFEPVDGHHFEVKAPQECGGGEPTEKTARKVVCQLTAPGTQKIALNICDDQKTYCKPVRYEMSVTAPAGWTPDAEAPGVRQPPRHDHPPVKGFIINKPDEALAAAKSEGKALFIHFYGIWCPPCNMLEEYVYGEPAFLQATSNMVRVMLDADSDLSWDWKAKFKIGGYPTVVVATPELEEIDRLVGSRPPGPFIAWVKGADVNRGLPISKLLAAHADPAAAPEDVKKRIGMYYAERKELDDAAKWLEGVTDERARVTLIETKQKIAERDGDAAQTTLLTQRLVQDFPNHVSYSRWVEELLEKKVAGAEALVPKARANLEAWKTSPLLGESGYIPADIWWMEADLRKATGDETGASMAYRESARLYGELAAKSSLKIARGANMERAYALHKAGDNEAAKALYEELSTAYADEFSFNYNFGHVLNELGERERALEYAKKAEANAYGDNWLRAIHLRAKIEDGLGQKDVAAKTIDDALAQTVIPRTTDVRTHGYVKRLRTLRAEIAKPAEPPKD